MKIPYYRVNAFTDSWSGGNPAGVCLLEQWLADDDLLAISKEIDLSETAFFVARKDRFELRWFTPKIEMDLCGHATLGTGAILLAASGAQGGSMSFHTKSGLLTVTQRPKGWFELELPSRKASPTHAPQNLVLGLDVELKEVRLSRDYLAVVESEEILQEIQPKYERLNELPALGVIVTAPGKDVDFVSRFFAPRVGILEDPVTGSAHCSLVPYWSKRLQKTTLTARQISPRGGELRCEDRGERVALLGRSLLTFEGHLFYEPQRPLPSSVSSALLPVVFLDPSATS